MTFVEALGSERSGSLFRTAKRRFSTSPLRSSKRLRISGDNERVITATECARARSHPDAISARSPCNACSEIDGPSQEVSPIHFAQNSGGKSVPKTPCKQPQQGNVGKPQFGPVSLFPRFKSVWPTSRANFIDFNRIVLYKSYFSVSNRGGDLVWPCCLVGIDRLPRPDCLQQ